MDFMRIYDLELTNRCNAKCWYCPHSTMKRLQGDVSLGTVFAVIKYMQSIKQDYIALHHMGEPLLHPIVGVILDKFWKAGIKTEFSTNGLILNQKRTEVLKNHPALIRIAIDSFYKSANFRYEIRQFLKEAQKYPETKISIHTVDGNDLTVFKNVSDPNQVIFENKVLDNWAGQIKGKSELAKSRQCYFTAYNYVSVLWDGTVVSCCLDSEGINKLGHITKMQLIKSNPRNNLCRGCAKLQFAKNGGWKI